MELNEAKKHILEFTRKKEYEAFCLWIEEELNKLHLKMEVVEDIYKLGILQGRVKNYRQMLQLEKEVSTL